MKKSVALLCSLGVLVNGVVFAAPIDSITQDEQGRIEIAGSLAQQGSFTVQVLEPGVNYEDITDGNVAEKIHAVGDFETDENGAYKEKLTMKKTAEDLAVYTVRVKGEGDSEAHEMTFTFYDTDFLNSEFEKFKSAANSESAYEIISDNEERFGINIEPYSSFSNDSKKNVTSVVFKTMEKDWTLEDLRAEYKKQSAAEAISVGKDALQILKTEADALGISQDKRYEIFKNMTENEQKEVSQKLKGSDLTTEETAKKSFAEAVFLTELKNAEGAGSVKELLTNNSDLFETGDLEKYLSLKDTSAVDSALAGKDFENIKDVSEKIKEKTSVKNNNGGSSGGSSGGSGGTLTGLGMNPGITQNVSDAEKAAFTDLDGVEWAKTSIEYLASKEIVNGRGNGIFDPNANVTREEFVKMLVLAFGLETENARSEFSDIPASDWSYPYVSAACQSGLVKGMSEELFGKGKYITRQDMAVLVWRFSQFKEVELPTGAITEFSDKGMISDYAVEAISALRAADIVSGMPGGEYKPLDSCTRAQAAKIIYTALSRCGLI